MRKRFTDYFSFKKNSIRILTAFFSLVSVVDSFCQPSEEIVVEVNKAFTISSGVSFCISGSCNTCSPEGFLRVDYGLKFTTSTVSYYWSNLITPGILTHTYNTVNMNGYEDIVLLTRTEESIFIDPGCQYWMSDTTELYSIRVKVEEALTFNIASGFCVGSNLNLKSLTNKRNPSEANLNVTFLVNNGPDKVGQNISDINELTVPGNYQIRAIYPFYNGPAFIDRNIDIHPLPHPPVINPPAAICAGKTSSILMPVSPGFVYDIYNSSTGGSIVPNGYGIQNNTAFTTPILYTTTTYYVETRNEATGCISPTRTPVTIEVYPLPPSPVVPPVTSICSGNTAEIVMPDVTNFLYDIYNVPSGSFPLPGGSGLVANATFTTPVLVNNTTYYVEARNPATGCVSASRTPVHITVNPNPDISLSVYSIVVRSGTLEKKIRILHTTANPDTYTLHWPAGGAGNVINGPLPADSLHITNITTTEGIFQGTLKVTVSATGCESQSKNLEIAVLKDHTPPIIELGSIPDFINLQNNIEINVRVTDPESGVTSTWISFGKSTSIDFSQTEVLMTKTDASNWTYTIPWTEVSELGLRLKIKAKNGENLTTESPILNIPVKHDGFGLIIPYDAFGKSTRNYRIISVPLSLQRKSVRNTLSDNLGPYNPYNWRLFRYESGYTSELFEDALINPGYGYWLIASKPATIDSGPGITVGSVESPVQIAVSSGWNLIGNPYLFKILWDDVVNHPLNTVLGIGPLRVFRSGFFENSSVLNVFEGAFVFVNYSGNLTFPATKNLTINSGRFKESHVESIYNSIDSEDWLIRFTVQNKQMVNTLSGIGMSPIAHEYYDPLDDFTLPRIGDFLEVNHHKMHHNIHFSRDIVPPAEEWKWTFTITASTNEETSISWENFYFDNSLKDLVLVHHDSGTPILMSKINQFRFFTPSTFTVHYGDIEKITKETAVNRLIVFDPYPNPANSTINLNIYIPENLGHASLSFSLISASTSADILSQHFTATPGFHHIKWSFSDLKQIPSAGLYVLRVQSGKEIIQKKVLIAGPR